MMNSFRVGWSSPITEGVDCPELCGVVDVLEMDSSDGLLRAVRVGDAVVEISVI